MRGNYASPSELLLALRETGKSYWDLIGKPLNQNTGYNLNNPHAAEEKQYNEWYDSLKLSDEDNIKLQQLLSEYDKNVKSNTDSLPKYKKGKDKFHSFAAQMGPRIYRELHKQGIYSSNTYDNMMRQLAWESNYANSLNAINNHNYAGIRTSATKYAKYKNDDLFAQEYVSLIKRKYPNAVKAKNPVLYAKALKDNGYYEDSVEHYALSLAAMSSISNAVKAHMAANPDQYEVEVLLEDLKKQSELPAVSTRVAKPINREPINKQPFVNTPIPTEAPLITRPEYLESNSLIKKSFELNMNNMLLGKDFLFKLPGFKKGKDSKKPLSDEQYIKIMEDVADANYERWGYPNQDAALLYALNANDYDYRGYYNKYPPNSANSLTHWSDEFKTAYHPSFSDESKYSGHKSKYNPDGIVGGHWYNEMFVPSFDQLRKLNKLPHFRGGKDGEGGNLFNGEEKHNQQIATKPKQAPWYSELDEAVLGEVMQQFRNIAHPGNSRDASYKGDVRGKNGGTAQRTYLLPRSEQEDIFLRDGYIKGKERDYGLVKKAVNNRNLPVWQTAPDAINRETLVPIGNVYGHDYGYIGLDKDLVHAGARPAAFYVDGSTGKLYTKGWDLNDYGGSTGAASSKYNIFEKIGANLLDFIGNPVVVTTGFQEVTNPWGGAEKHLSRGATIQDLFVPDDEGYPVATTVGKMLDDTMSKKGLHRELVGGKWLYALPEVTVTGNKHGLHNHKTSRGSARKGNTKK